MNGTVLDISLKELNVKFKSLQPEQRIIELYKMFLPEEIMLTSSFATTSSLFTTFIFDI